VNKSATIRARIEPDLKNRAKKVFRELGLSTTQAINLFYKQVELRNGLLFEVVIPNDVTRRIFSNTDTGKDLIVCEDADDMFRKLGI
jgi:DNA-damage-inducible protein J